MSRPGSSGSSLRELEDALRSEHAVHVQKLVRRFISRCRVHRLVLTRFEKIWDPRRQEYYYYDTVRDASSWNRPRVLGEHDLKEIAPTYTRDEAATMIQRQLLRRWALRRMRMLYQASVIATLDEGSGEYYYFNPSTSYTAWELPFFMGRPGRFDYAYDDLPKTVRWGPDGVIGADGEDDDSDASVESAVLRQRRRDKRRRPRSKLQVAMDAVEDNFTTLRSLTLVGAAAERISSRLYDMTNLTTLSLAHNRLERLSTSMQYLVKLQSLDLSHNALLRLPKEMEELVVLKDLNVSFNRLSNFSGYLYKLSSLQSLDLSHNLFRDLPVETGNLELFKATRQWDVGIQCLKGLLVFKMSHNLLSNYPTQLDKLARVKEVDLCFNSLQTLPSSILANKALTALDVSSNRLRALPPELYRLPLKRLLLHNNCLEDLPRLDADAIEGLCMTDLQEFDISRNLLTTLDARLSVLATVKSLDVSDNKLESIDEALSTLGNLTYLNLAHNRIGAMPAGLAGCKSLTSLELQNNELTVMPSGLSTLRALTSLNISNNRIAEAPITVFSACTLLCTINLRDNLLPRLPQSFYALARLTHIDLTNNRLEGPVPKALGQLRELESLLMKDNLLTSLPESISQLTRLRVLELENNQIGPELPLGLSCLKQLWRCTTRKNLLERAPEGLFHLPLLTAWDLSWNRRIVGNYVDWIASEAAFTPEADLMSLAMLTRLVQRAWRYLDAQPLPAPPVIPPPLPPIHLADDAKGVEETKSSSKSSESSEKGSSKKQKKKQQKTQKKKGLSKREQREAEAAKRQSLNDVLAWHDRLRQHFQEHLPAPEAPSSARNNQSTSETEALARVTASIQLAQAQRRVRVQLISLFRTTGLTHRALARRQPQFACKILSSSPDAAPNTVADADALEALDIGARFQPVIELFSSAAHEISVLATIRYAEDRKAQAEADRDARRERDRVRVKEAESRAKLAAEGGNYVYDDDDKAGLQTARSREPMTSRSNTTEGQALLALAMGPAEEALAKQTDVVAVEKEEEGSFGSEYDVSAQPKSSLFRLDAPPLLHHHPHLVPSHAELHTLACECYLGLGIALVRRVDCLTLSIREIEKRSGLPSVLGVAHRLGDDLEDLAADSFMEITERLKIQEQQSGASIVAVKQGRMAALLAQSGVSETAVDIDQDDEESAREKVKAQKEAKKNEKESKRKAEIALLSDKRSHKAEAAEENEAVEEEQEPETESEAESLKSSKNTHTGDAARAMRTFLLDHRSLTLLWALKALDAAAELLQMRGWDPARFDPAADAGSKKRSVDSLASASCKGRATVERGAEHLADVAIRLHLIRGRAMLLSDRPREALLDFRCAVLVGRHKFFREAALQAVQAHLADTNYAGARAALVDYVTDEVPGADRRFPEPSVLLKHDKRLACLLMLSNAGIDMLRSAGVGSPSQTLVFRVRADGLLERPPAIRESEFHVKRNPRDEIVLAERAAQSVAEEKMAAREAEQQTLLAQIDYLRGEHEAKLEHSRQELLEIIEAARVAEIESQEKERDRAAKEAQARAEMSAKRGATFAQRTKALSGPGAQKGKPDTSTGGRGGGGGGRGGGGGGRVGGRGRGGGGGGGSGRGARSQSPAARGAAAAGKKK